ncbi:MAG: GTPase ObgE [Magnetococcales bacterium]|nr:GTPase ObgE [Magnetococcales bacterium]
MQFFDEVRVYVRSGDGGNGIVAFRREKYVPYGGPDGGDGGCGGDVVFIADPQQNTLVDLHYRPHLKAARGGDGMGKSRTGRSVPALEVKVPVGTLVRDNSTGQLLSDLRHAGDRFVAAVGGRGGRGNVHFKSSVNRTPRYAEPGTPGQEQWLHLELKLLADVGLVGQPNAGKSTLLTAVSAARPKVADYPFTTITPHLGVVSVSALEQFVMADIPGLISGASDGQGLGHLFLRHIERCAVLLHLVEAAPADESDPVVNFQAIEHELACYAPGLADKPRLIVLTKSDLVDAEQQATLLGRLQQLSGDRQPPLVISAVSGVGLSELLQQSFLYVQRARAQQRQWLSLPDAPTRAGHSNVTEAEEQASPAASDLGTFDWDAATADWEEDEDNEPS